MRKINLIVIHCSATRSNQTFTEKDLERAHLERGFKGTGYHFYIRKNGALISTRPVEIAGAHAFGHNANSIGICYEGGLNEQGEPQDTRTPQQKRSLQAVIRAIHNEFPDCRVCGHRDLSPDLNNDGLIEPSEWTKICPCFDATAAYAENCVPAYALNPKTHNYVALINSLNNLRINDTPQRNAIIALSNYGKKSTPIWCLIWNTKWSEIKTPGLYLIAKLKTKKQ